MGTGEETVEEYLRGEGREEWKGLGRTNAKVGKRRETGAAAPQGNGLSVMIDERQRGSRAEGENARGSVKIKKGEIGDMREKT